jgi:hypothetical protein
MPPGAIGEYRGGFDRFAALLGATGTLHAWRVTDGEHRALTPPTSVEFTGLAGVLHDEILLPVWQPKPATPFEGYTIYRIPIESMPVVTP